MWGLRKRVVELVALVFLDKDLVVKTKEKFQKLSSNLINLQGICYLFGGERITTWRHLKTQTRLHTLVGFPNRKRSSTHTPFFQITLENDLSLIGNKKEIEIVSKFHTKPNTKPPS